LRNARFIPKVLDDVPSGPRAALRISRPAYTVVREAVNAGARKPRLAWHMTPVLK
jgi:hypothetical protein